MQTWNYAFLGIICLSGLVHSAAAQAQTTWYWVFTSTPATLDWGAFLSSFGTWPANMTTQGRWWDLTTSTTPLAISTVEATTGFVTEPPVMPEIVESTDTIFLAVIIVACILGLVIAGILVVVIYKMMTEKKHKKTKRLRVKPLKADQAFAPVMHPGLGMGMGMGMPGGMMPAMPGMPDMGMPGQMPGMMAPMDTSVMGYGMQQGYGGMEPGEMDAMEAGIMGVAIDQKQPL